MRNQIEVAAREKFGEPNARLSSKHELRFGSHGSKAVALAGDDAGSWYDFETEEGGHLGAAEEVVVPFVRLIVKKYDYHDAAGKLVMQVCRYMPKEFRQRRPDGNGNWIWSVKDIEPVPYRLPEILGADEVVIVEGEKDADNLMAAGIVATTKSGGSGRWPEAMSKYFAGKRVYVLPDNDEAGRKTGLNTAAALAGVADHVAYCDVFAGMRAKADASDWLEEGGDPEALMERVRTYPAFEEDEALEGLDIFPTIDADGMAPALSADDFVEGLLISTQMSVVYGPSNSGKTFFAADLALHVALGWNWRGLEVDQGGVIYIAAEGSYGIQNRVAAFKQAHEIDETVPFSVIPVSVNMYDSEEEIERLINTVKVKARAFGSVSLVVVDTLARVMSGGDENTAVDMGQFVGHCDDLRFTTGAHVMVVHHSGKDVSKGARGSSSLRAATDTEIEIEPGEGFSVARVEKQRELELGGEYVFSLSVVELGKNQRGKPVTSCVVEALDEVPESKKQREKRPGGRNQRLLLKALKNALASHSFEYSGRNCVSEEQWQAEAYRLLAGEAKHKSTTFLRAADALVADEFVGRDGDHIWVV